MKIQLKRYLNPGRGLNQSPFNRNDGP